MNSNRISRRSILKGAIAGAVVLGFDPLARSWITAASAQPGIELPPLDGVLLTDPATLTAAADDFGHIVHRLPIAVLKPGSVKDIVHMVRYARRQGLKIGARGQGHTAFGQSQVEAGVVIDMSTLNTAPVVTGDRADVRAGVMWRDLLSATLPHGLTVPVLTGYVGLSVGGTLSVGGIGGGSFRYGAQVDNVLELEVVTGEGRLEVCSATEKSDLFEAVLAGLGQCAIIISAGIRLIPAHTQARVMNLFYADLHAMLQDERLLVADGRFDELVGFVVPSPAGGWAMFITAARYFTPAEGREVHPAVAPGPRRRGFLSVRHPAHGTRSCGGRRDGRQQPGALRARPRLGQQALYDQRDPALPGGLEAALPAGMGGAGKRQANLRPRQRADAGTGYLRQRQRLRCRSSLYEARGARDTAPRATGDFLFFRVPASSPGNGY